LPDGLGSVRHFIRLKLVEAPGYTRRNVTMVDTTSGREMHLRSANRLACAGTLRKLAAQLLSVVDKDSICVFAGAMPAGALFPAVLRLVKICRDKQAKIVLDTSGPALREIIETGWVWLITPNVKELSEMLGRRIYNRAGAVAGAGSELLGKAGCVLISRGEKGAIVVTETGAWQGDSRLRGLPAGRISQGFLGRM